MVYHFVFYISIDKCVKELYILFLLQEHLLNMALGCQLFFFLSLVFVSEVLAMDGCEYKGQFRCGDKCL